MGGRGASSGISLKGRSYGTDYKTLHTEGNIKFVKRTSEDSEILLETMTPNRVYAIIGNNDSITAIHFMGEDLKKYKTIHLNHTHHGEKPHRHFGYYSDEYTKGRSVKLNKKEVGIVDKVIKIWDTVK